MLVSSPLSSQHILSVDDELQFKLEREICREIADGRVPYLRQVIEDLFVDKVGSEYYKKSKSKEIRLLCLMSVVFLGDSATIHRLQFRMQQHQIRFRYSKKILTPNERLEGRLSLKSFHHAYELIQNIPAISASLLKTSLKTDFVSKAGSKFRVSLDECCAVDPSNAKVKSPPFAFVEVEDRLGVDLDAVRSSSDTWKAINPFLAPLRFPNLNKVRRCWELYPGRRYIPQGEADLKDYVMTAI